jgi:hypothetical protein
MIILTNLVSIGLLLLALGVMADTLFGNADKVLQALRAPVSPLAHRDYVPLAFAQPPVVLCSRIQRPANSNATATRSLPLAA